jgi:protoporphyrinogen oxidase
MKEKVDFLILGAGLAGLSFAYHLRKNNNYIILEKEDEIGGLIRSKKLKGFVFDYSAHLLHTRTKSFAGWLKKNFGNRLNHHNRNAWIYSHGAYTKYPFQANFYGLPKNIVKECLEGLVFKKNNLHEEKNFKEWIEKTFGKGIARHFMVPYNRKFWTLEPKYLTLEWIDGFIPQPTLKDVLDGTFEYNPKEFGYNNKFWYPKEGGINILTEKISKDLKNIILSEGVKLINPREKRIETNNGNVFYYEKLILTIPLPELKILIPNSPIYLKEVIEQLRYTSIININFGIKRGNISNKDWIYFPEDNFIFYRVGFPMNFSQNSTPKGMSSIYVDISYSNWKPLDKKNIFNKVRQDLIKAGILEKEDEIVVKDSNDIKYGYIIYDKNWQKSRNIILDYLRENNIFTCGRFGSWHYASMEKTFLEAQKLAGYFS